MSARFQSWLLRNTTGLQYLVNERLATRSGAIGRFFKFFSLGERQYSSHSLARALRVVNYFHLMIYQQFGMHRPVLSRFIGANHGPLNYSALWVYIFVTGCVINRFRFQRPKDTLFFNYQDQPEFWFMRYGLMFPPSFLHNRLSAHYIEINHIFCVEMMRKYQHARREIIAEREKHSDEVKRTRFATNANYIYEPLGADDDKIKRSKDDGRF